MRVLAVAVVPFHSVVTSGLARLYIRSCASDGGGADSHGRILDEFKELVDEGNVKVYVEGV